MENKTPEEILSKYEDYNEYHFHNLDKAWIVEAMEEYGKQQYNQGVLDCIENATIQVVEYSKHGGKIISSSDLGQEISADGYQQYYNINEESMKKLIKQ